jgi:peptide/nickel transport system ATP-binding protein
VTLLTVSDLTVSFPTPDGVVHAVSELSFSVERGETLAIVGESGSGKSVTALTLMGLADGARVSGRALFEEADLLQMDEPSLRAIRGAEMAMIFQDPLSALHPLYRVGWQIAEVIRAHEPAVSKRDARARAIELLSLVGIPQARQRVDDYPHEYSGGMRQRAMIAMALALGPQLLIADEPTTALDVAVQAQILAMMQQLQRQLGTAIMFITHDLRIVAEMADDVLVMYAGTAMETATRDQLFRDHYHPYTEGLLHSLPRAAGPQRRLTPIPGQPPSAIDRPPGCPFEPRCPHRRDRCARERPPMLPVGESTTHRSACWLALEADAETGPGSTNERRGEGP